MATNKIPDGTPVADAPAAAPKRNTHVLGQSFMFPPEL